MDFKMDEIQKVKKGDMLWVKLKNASYDYGYGEVINFWFDEKINDNIFEFHCLVNGGLRMGLSKNIIDNNLQCNPIKKKINNGILCN